MHPQARRRQIAFSLVEVVLAMSIVSFACITLFGLLANGLITANRAVGTTVQGQIIQAIIDDSQVHAYNPTYATNMYFTDQGTVVPQTDPTEVYGAQITAANFQTGLPSTNSGVVLKISVVSRAAPSLTNSFSLIWSNSGN